MNDATRRAVDAYESAAAARVAAVLADQVASSALAAPGVDRDVYHDAIGPIANRAFRSILASDPRAERRKADA